MPIQQDQAIALYRLDYSETSQVLAFFTRASGMQRLIAKGIKRGTRKKFATGIDLLEQGYLSFTRTGAQGQLGKLTDWRQMELYYELRQRLDRLYAGQYVAEITAAMCEIDDPHPRLYDGLVRLLQNLQQAHDVFGSLVAYQRLLLLETGLAPVLDECVICARPAPPRRPAYFSAHQGGVICRKCQPSQHEHRLLSAEVLESLRTAPHSETEAMTCFEVYDYYLSHVMGRRPRLSAYLLADERKSGLPYTHSD